MHAFCIRRGYRYVENIDFVDAVNEVFEKYKDKYQRYMAADANVSERTYYSNQTAFIALCDVQDEIKKLINKHVI